MRRIHISKISFAFFVGLTMFLTMGVGHSLLSSRQSSVHASGIGDTKTHCHASCLLSVNDQQKKLTAEEDDTDPDPFTVPFYNARYAAILYTVAFSSLVLLLLKRKPPDLLSLNVYWRN